MFKRLKEKKDLLLLPTACKTPPRTVRIEPTNICNLKCPLCINSKIPEKEKKHLRFDEFKFVLERLDCGRPDIILTNWGEPFLNPDIFKIIRYAKTRGHFVYVSTHLNIREEMIDEIVRSGLDMICLSIDGLSHETYSRYRIGSDFRRVLENMLLLKKARDRYNATHLNIDWQFIPNRHNQHEIGDALAFADKNGIKITLLEMGLSDDMPEYEFGDLEDLKKEWLPKDTKYIRRYYKGSMPYHTAEGVCPFLWESVTVNVDMQILPCCHTYTKESYFGDLRQNTIMEIWNSDHYRAARELFNKKGDSAVSTDTICSRCSNYAKGKGRLYHYKTLISKRLKG